MTMFQFLLLKFQLYLGSLTNVKGRILLGLLLVTLGVIPKNPKASFMENGKDEPLGNNEKQEILHQHKATAAGVITSPSLPLTILTYLPGDC